MSFCVALLIASPALATSPIKKQPVPPYAYSAARARLAQPPSPCSVLSKKLLELGGSRAIACSETASLSGAFECANQAIRKHRPFTLCDASNSFDSFCERAVVGLSDGNLLEFSFDSEGPAKYGTCLRQNVTTAPDQWPQCRTALIDETDIRTNRPYEESSSKRGEAWPAACASEALRATNSIRPMLLNPGPLIANSQRWDLDCESSPVELELLVSENGDTKCARIVDPTSLPDTLRSEIMTNVSLFRFAPPQINGTVVAVRFYFTSWKPCAAR
jgi:hypothetical protein